MMRAIYMSKCASRDCNAEVVGGFQANADIGSLQGSAAEILELRRYWCEAHENTLADGLMNGRYLNYDELD